MMILMILMILDRFLVPILLEIANIGRMMPLDSPFDRIQIAELGIDERKNIFGSNLN